MTLPFATDILKEMNDEFKANAKIHGCEVEEESQYHEATSSDIAALMAFTGKK